MKELKDKLQTVKVDNERILELNQILLDKIHNKEKYKRNTYEIDFEKVSYKHEDNKLNLSDSESSSGVNVRSHRGGYNNTSESSESDCRPRKRKYKPYEETKENLKR